MLKLSDLLISSQETLRSAMQRMTRNRKGILFVCDRETHLLGAISDGDIRRVLLEDTLLLSGIGKVMNLNPITASTTDEAIDLARRGRLVAVPVVDAEGWVKEAVLEEGDEIKVLPLMHQEEVCAADVDRLQVLAIVPARGGSKRIPRKNLAIVAGKPLVEWAILAAKSARHVSYVVVSTDDQEIADTAGRAGAIVPWLRPAELAQDNTPTLDVVLHTLEWAIQSLRPLPELAVLLEPTAPLRLSEHLDQAVEMLAAGDADCVLSVSEVPHLLNPEELLSMNNNGLLRPYLPSRTMDSRVLRGEQEPAFVPNGLVYAFRIPSVLEQRCIYGRKTLPLITSWNSFLDIDVTADVELANFKKGRAHAKNQ